MIGSGVRRIEPTAQVMLFGSRARGNARPDSDWDVMVLLDDNSKTDKFALSNAILNLGWDVNEDFSPVVYRQSEWKSKSFTPFYKNVMREKIEL